MTYYKWMLEGHLTGYQKTSWPVAMRAWTPEETPVLCQSGWHGCQSTDLIFHLPCAESFELFIVEGRGTCAVGEDKVAFAQMKLVERVGVCDQRLLRLFAADCAERVLPIFYKFLPNDQRPSLAIQAARDYANGKITGRPWAAPRDAAHDAARDAARDAAYDAAANAAAYAAKAAAAAAYAANAAAATNAANDAAYAAYANAAAANDAAAPHAAGAAARDAEKEWQADHLIEMIRLGQAAR
jgi:hypothetical protein